ncbi:GPI transamidase component PIG-T [Selaginella moellendorffii]|uniref:GPI transamidase component PIG-T n=1 Tax=Selaginella moellendorffii TaxID=88036 RepID=UPI000D1CA2B9|nr:GPI transamidase component PIG-T [Selaginella moellendorffii]|eukprot:XP_024520708.1 GPI transamidase component PIG-T [Selaginella moellendorffii]
MPPRVLTLTPSTFLSGRVKSNPTFFCRSSSSSGSFESKKWQGRWNNERWGVGDPITQLAAKPVGVELTAFPEAEVDSTWGNLTHALSVLFCASINFLELPTTFLGPWFSSRPESLMTRYGALPREALCRTPRLTPWLTLLPCRDKAGLTTLLDRQTIYSGMYHSQRLLITSGDFDRDEEGTTLEQVVFRKLQDWTLSSMFGSKLSQPCSKSGARVLFTLSFSGTHSELDLGITWTAPVDWSPARAQFYTSWSLAGSGNARGSIVISFRANDGSSRDCYSPGIEAAEDDTEQKIAKLLRLWRLLCEFLLQPRP